MITPIRLLAQSKSMRSIIDATRGEQWHGSALFLNVCKDGVPAAPTHSTQPRTQPILRLYRTRVAERSDFRAGFIVAKWAEYLKH